MKKQQGFSLIELLIVVAIILVLAAIADAQSLVLDLGGPALAVRAQPGLAARERVGVSLLLPVLADAPLCRHATAGNELRRPDVLRLRCDLD